MKLLNWILDLLITIVAFPILFLLAVFVFFPIEVTRGWTCQEQRRMTTRRGIT